MRRRSASGTRKGGRGGWVCGTDSSIDLDFGEDVGDWRGKGRGGQGVG